jgi:butyrate kinase
MVKTIAQVVIVPGEYEMQALASGAVRILSGKEEAKKY